VKKKIIFYHPYFGDGGAEKTNLLISAKLSKKYDIFFLSHFFSKKFDNEIKKNNIKKIQTSSTRTIFSIFEIIKIYRKIKPDLIFSIQVHANVFTIIINKLFFNGKLKVICCERISIQKYESYFKGKIIIFLAKIFYKYSKLIICNSKELYKEFKNLSKNLKVIYIYNPTLKLNLKTLSKKFLVKSKPFLNKKRSIIFSLGRLDDVKNHIMILKAYNEIKNKIKCDIVLMGDGENKNLLINYAKKNNFDKNLFIYNFQKNPFPYLVKSDIFILSSKYEGLPNVLIEALALKKFVISSNCPTGPKEILLNGKAGLLVNVDDYMDLSKKIRTYFNKPLLVKQKKSFIKKSLQQFSSSNSLNKYQEVVDSLL
jgi:glycosyltransferase involved in cell wall biosynthesis